MSSVRVPWTFEMGCDIAFFEAIRSTMGQTQKGVFAKFSCRGGHILPLYPDDALYLRRRRGQGDVAVEPRLQQYPNASGGARFMSLPHISTRLNKLSTPFDREDI